MEDIPVLAEHFRTEALGREADSPLGEGALRALASQVWPGNVRELRNVIFRLVLDHKGDPSREDVEMAMGKGRPRGLFSPEVLRSRPIADLVGWGTTSRADHSPSGTESHRRQSSSAGRGFPASSRSPQSRQAMKSSGEDASILSQSLS